jgi:demethylmenaquinone methyltransferase/2-methoxy-6-polyprenyl-1,4-benzoquinol methylase
MEKPETVLSDAYQKRAYAQKIFSIVASSYHTATRILSFGVDSRLKRMCVAALDSKIDGAILDLATGDGDFIPLIRARCPSVTIIGYDLTAEMLSLAVANIIGIKNCLLVQGDMMKLGIKEKSIRAITGGYALRNAPDLHGAITQIRRVLVNDGTAIFLEFTRSPNALFSFIQIRLLQIWCGLWGLLFHGKSQSYGYIADTVRLYPDRRKIHQLFLTNGFDIVKSQVAMFGFLEVLVVRKNGGSISSNK